jgi:glycine betaine/proline transport system substrate-binding protein
VYDAGVKSFSDLVKFKKEFANRIYGLEKGNDGNLIIQQMIDKNESGLGAFNLLATSERIMLAQLKKRVRENQWIVFLAWTPHPMNNKFDIRYLDGGDKYFGPNYGGSTVHTNVRAGFTQDCPNINKLLKNLVFDVEMEATMMDKVLNEFAPADRAARYWMHKNPKQVTKWLNGVNTREGKPANVEKIISNLELTFGK